MIDEAGRTLFATLSNDFLVFLNRPLVQGQLLAILVAFFIAQVIWLKLSKRINQRFSEPTALLTRVFYFALKYLLFSVLVYTLLQLFSLGLWLASFEIGLIKLVINIVVFYAVLQVILIAIYLLGDAKSIDGFRDRWFKPFVALLILGQIINILKPTSTILATNILSFANTPITLRSVLIGTVGLYFWIVGVQAVDTAIHYLAVKYLAFRSGGLKATLTLLRYILVIGGIAFVLGQFNFNTTTIAAITGGLSVGIGFALSTVLSNFVSGLLLLFERSIQPGDILEFDNELSIVEDVQMRAMRVRTLNNIEKFIPNTDFVSSPFTTYTGTSNRIRISTEIGASYKDAPRDVMSVLLDVAKTNEAILKDPEPEVQLVGFGDSSINYILKCWIAAPLQRAGTISALNVAIYEAFEQHDFTIPFPQRDVHLRVNQQTETV